VRFIYLYLLAYFALVIGAGLALWQAGVVHQVPGTWLFIAAVVALGPGILLAITAIGTNADRSELRS